MNILMVLAVVAAAIVFVAISRKVAPEDESCAKEISLLFKQNRRADAEQVAAIMQQHDRSFENVGQVTRLMKPKLTRLGIPKDEVNDALVEVRKAKLLLKGD